MQMMTPTLLEELGEIPEQYVNQAAAFILLAMARVQDPNASVVVINVNTREVLAGEIVEGADVGAGHFMVRTANEFSSVPALPNALPDGGAGHDRAAASAEGERGAEAAAG